MPGELRPVGRSQARDVDRVLAPRDRIPVGSLWALGVGSVSSERMTACSGSACRRSAQARIASGAVSFHRFMNTPVPGVLITGGSIVRRSSTKGL